MAKKYKKALVAVDGSESGYHALKESFKFACKEKCWITAVCVSPSYEGDLHTIALDSILESVKAPCRDAINQAMSIAKQSRVLIKTVSEEGEPYLRIVDLAEQEDAEIIIMGRRGLSRIERAFVGSVAARVIGHSQRDVLIVPKDASMGWDKILLAIDGSKYSKAAISRAIDFASTYKGELRILSIVDMPAEFYGEAHQIVDELIERAQRYVEDAARQASQHGVRSETFVREGETHRMIMDVAEDLGASAIVLGSHGRTGLRRLLMGSVTEKVIGYSHCPVLVVKA